MKKVSCVLKFIPDNNNFNTQSMWVRPKEQEESLYNFINTQNLRNLKSQPGKATKRRELSRYQSIHSMDQAILISKVQNRNRKSAMNRKTLIKDTITKSNKGRESTASSNFDLPKLKLLVKDQIYRYQHPKDLQSNIMPQQNPSKSNQQSIVQIQPQRISRDIYELKPETPCPKYLRTVSSNSYNSQIQNSLRPKLRIKSKHNKQEEVRRYKTEMKEILRRRINEISKATKDDYDKQIPHLLEESTLDYLSQLKRNKSYLGQPRNESIVKTDPERTSLQENIFEVRCLMHKYLLKAPISKQ